MSGTPEALQLRMDDLAKMLIAQTHVGSNNVDFQMEQYIWKRKNDGTYLINLKKTWEKLLLAARAICAIENPADVCIISARPYGQRGILKFAQHTGATAVDGRFTPGTFTNQIQSAFREPRLLIVTDSRLDHQAIVEASYVNIPVIAFCNTDSPLKLVDISIPGNNKGNHSLGLMLWMLAREVLIMQGKTSRVLTDGLRSTIFMLDGKEVMVDLYFYRDPEEVSKQEQPTREEEVEKQPAFVISVFSHFRDPEEVSKQEQPTREEEPEKQPAFAESDQWGQELNAPGGVGMNWPGTGAMGGGMSNLAGTTDFGAPQDWAMETQQAAQHWATGPPAAAQAAPASAGARCRHWNGMGRRWCRMEVIARRDVKVLFWNKTLNG